MKSLTAFLHSQWNLCTELLYSVVGAGYYNDPILVACGINITLFGALGGSKRTCHISNKDEQKMLYVFGSGIWGRLEAIILL